MATKKLRAELEVDTTKAKQKVRELSETGGAAVDGGAADEASRSLKDLARSARDAGSNLKGSGADIKNAVRAFAGMGIGLATSYAAAHMDPGSPMQRTLGYLGSMATYGTMGATMGSVVPGYGTAIGTAVGVGVGATKQALDNEADEEKAAAAREEAIAARLKSVETWEDVRKQTLAFRDLIERLTNEGTSLADRLEAVREEIAVRERADNSLAEAQKMYADVDDGVAFGDYTRQRQQNTQELDALTALQKRIEKEMEPKAKRGGAADWNAVDSLSSVGGMFAGGGAGARALDDIASSTAEAVKVLKNIDKNTQGGGATWQ